jgi:lipopolysaccharide/colanic/teichoic acid biosynthesis glycosyltransferase
MSVQLIIKRLLDIAVAASALVVLAPVIALVALLVRLRMGSPILFRQMRPGYRAVPFEVLKFRTMRDACDVDGCPLPDGDRLTPLGGFLRRMSLDELPQLWNVLRGEMSLVGPRPFLLDYLEVYSPEQMRRHDVKPGITGLAQVRGRNALGWDEKFACDVWYADNWSLWLDLRILAATAMIVVRRQGISGAGVATMTRFDQEMERSR